MFKIGDGDVEWVGRQSIHPASTAAELSLQIHDDEEENGKDENHGKVQLTVGVESSSLPYPDIGS